MIFKREHESSTSGDPRESLWTSRRGQVTVIFASSLVLLLAMVAMAVDAGFLLSERRQVQNSADSAALAAAKAKLDYGLAPNAETEQFEAAYRYGTVNADTVPANIDVDIDPEGLGDEFVRVTIARDVETFFLRALYTGEWRVSATAVAGIVPVFRPYALVALQCGVGGNDGIYINGSGQVNVNEGSIMSNCGVDRSGQSNVVTSGGSIDSHGPINAGSLWHAENGYNPYRSPIEDPIVRAGVEPPNRAAAQAIRNVVDRPGLEAAITNLSNLSATSGRCAGGTTCVMQPGYYGGNLTLDIRGTLLMQPGIYYFGGNFRFEGQSASARIQGTDVMLYFADTSRFDPGNARIDIAASQTSLYSGGLDGMLFWIANCTPFMMQSNGQFNMEGVIYAPCSQVRLYGSPGSNGIQVVVGSLELAGSGTFDILFRNYVDADTPEVFLVQ